MLPGSGTNHYGAANAANLESFGFIDQVKGLNLLWIHPQFINDRSSNKKIG
jgi:hypothetical protein